MLQYFRVTDCSIQLYKMVEAIFEGDHGDIVERMTLFFPKIHIVFFCICIENDSYKLHRAYGKSVYPSKTQISFHGLIPIFFYLHGS